MSKYIKNIYKVIGEMFSNILYIVLASTLALLAFVLAVWLPNLGLITEILTTSSAPLAAKLKIAASLLGGIGTNFSILSASYTIAIAILFGVNVAMVVYFLKKRRRQIEGKGFIAGIGGITSGALGVGCAACGSFLLSTILASFGAASALAILPLKGGEFGIVSVALLGLTLGIVSNKIAEPLTCEPEKPWQEK